MLTTIIGKICTVLSISAGREFYKAINATRETTMSISGISSSSSGINFYQTEAERKAQQDAAVKAGEKEEYVSPGKALLNANSRALDIIRLMRLLPGRLTHRLFEGQVGPSLHRLPVQGCSGIFQPVPEPFYP